MKKIDVLTLSTRLKENNCKNVIIKQVQDLEDTTKVTFSYKEIENELLFQEVYNEVLVISLDVGNISMDDMIIDFIVNALNE